VCKDKLAKPVVDIFSAGVIEPHVEFDEEAHEKVEVEVGHESVRVDVANATCVVGNVENKLWELCRSVHGAAVRERGWMLRGNPVPGGGGEYLPTSASTPTSIYLVAVHRLRP
jgi:hypothetical protein